MKSTNFLMVRVASLTCLISLVIRDDHVFFFSVEFCVCAGVVTVRTGAYVRECVPCVVDRCICVRGSMLWLVCSCVCV